MVTVRPYKSGGWEVDINLMLPNGVPYRKRVKAPALSRPAARKWGEDHVRDLLTNGLPQPKKEVPTLKEFAVRFINEHAKANQQKPSGIAAKQTILDRHLLPRFGTRRLNDIKTEDVQRLKAGLRARKPKTVNNVLTVLNTLLKKAVEWGVIDLVPCSVKLLPAAKPTAAFHDFGAFEQLRTSAARLDWRTELVVLLGGEAGLRCGEIMALEWTDIDLAQGELTVQRSTWKEHTTLPKGGRFRHVPLTRRLAAALKSHRHLRGPFVVCQADGQALTQKVVQELVRHAANAAGVKAGVHILRHTFCSHLAMRGAPARAIQELAGHQDLGTTQRYMHLSQAATEMAIRLLDVPANVEMTGAVVETGIR